MSTLATSEDASARDGEVVGWLVLTASTLGGVGARDTRGFAGSGCAEAGIGFGVIAARTGVSVVDFEVVEPGCVPDTFATTGVDSDFFSSRGTAGAGVLVVISGFSPDCDLCGTIASVICRGV